MDVERKGERERETCATIIDCEGKSIVPKLFFMCCVLVSFFSTIRVLTIATSS